MDTIVQHKYMKNDHSDLRDLLTQLNTVQLGARPFNFFSRNGVRGPPEQGGYILQDSWKLSSDVVVRRVCGDIESIITFFEHNPDLRDVNILQDLRTMLEHVKANHELSELSLETLQVVLSEMDRKKDPLRRGEWETVNTMVRGLIRDIKSGMASGYRVPMRKSKP
jgi:hypothetical protein